MNQPYYSLKGTLRVWADGVLIGEIQNTIVLNALTVGIKALSGYLDERLIHVVFGDSNIATVDSDLAVHGTTTFSKKVDSVVVDAWNQVTVRFSLLPREASQLAIREVALYADTSRTLFSRTIMRTLRKGSSTVEFEWTFGYREPA